MFQSLTVRNFRCFREICVEPLERINLIAGTNNAGKTSLLEAVFLLIGWNNPQLPTTINVLRGISQFEPTPEDLWGWLFHNKRTGTPAVVEGIGHEGKGETLEIRLTELSKPPSFDEESRKFVIEEENVGSTTPLRSPGLVLRHTDREAAVHECVAYIARDKQLKFAPVPDTAVSMGIFLTARSRGIKEDAERFSKLEETGRQDEVVEVLAKLEPRLRRLSILVSSGIPVICGDIGIGKLLPLPLMGEGMVRLLSMVLAIMTATHGVVLIDEVENGLHYSALGDVWRAIGHAARKADTQIFATTHSWECIKAAHEAFSPEDAYDFALHRVDKVDGDIASVTYDREALDASLAAELEVR